MESLPKIAGQRLEKMAKPGPHPDANQLTALVEKSLGGNERARLLEHLSACVDCREVLALSLPQLESAQLSVVPARSGWLRGPVLRWGAAAACVVVVGAAVTRHYRPAPQSAVYVDSDYKNGRVAEMQPEAAPAEEAKKQSSDAVQNGYRVAVPSLDQQVNHPQRAEARQAASANSVGGAKDSLAFATPPPAALAPHSQLFSKGELQDQDKDAQETDRRAKRENAPRASSEEVVVSTQPVATVDTGELALGKAKEPLQKTDAAGLKAEVAAKAMTASIARKDGSVASGLVLAPRWTLSADGTLQRSFNAGKNWETIPVAKEAKFRALAAVGTEIWVGGAAGILYHSSDAGGRWTQVKPVADGKPLTADIIGVEFTDTQHGKLTTAGDMTWITVDGGQTWQIK